MSELRKVTAVGNLTTNVGYDTTINTADGKTVAIRVVGADLDSEAWSRGIACVNVYVRPIDPKYNGADAIWKQYVNGMILEYDINKEWF